MTGRTVESNGPACGLERAVALGVALAMLVAAGCSSTASLEPLGVNLVDLEVGEITLFEATLIARVRITNPNPDPIEISGGSLKLLLDGKKTGTALASQGFAVAGFDSTVVDMAVNVNTAAAITRIPAILEKDSISYGVSGAFYSDGPFGRVRHAVERSGTLDLNDLRTSDGEATLRAPAPSS